jgi:hypothetical protein
MGFVGGIASDMCFGEVVADDTQEDPFKRVKFESDENGWEKTYVASVNVIREMDHAMIVGHGRGLGKYKPTLHLKPGGENRLEPKDARYRHFLKALADRTRIGDRIFVYPIRLNTSHAHTKSQLCVAAHSFTHFFCCSALIVTHVAW